MVKDPPLDTSPEVERLLVEGFRRMDPASKIERVCSMNRMLRELEEARIRAAFGPKITDREVKLRVAALWLGRRTMVRTFGWDPEVSGY